MIIHNGTKIESQFLLVENGNVIKTFTVTSNPGDNLDIRVLNDENFLKALKTILDIREKLSADCHPKS